MKEQISKEKQNTSSVEEQLSKAQGEIKEFKEKFRSAKLVIKEKESKINILEDQLDEFERNAKNFNYKLEQSSKAQTQSEETLNTFKSEFLQQERLLKSRLKNAEEQSNKAFRLVEELKKEKLQKELQFEQLNTTNKNLIKENERLSVDITLQTNVNDDISKKNFEKDQIIESLELKHFEALEKLEVQHSFQYILYSSYHFQFLYNFQFYTILYKHVSSLLPGDLYLIISTKKEKD